MIGTLLWRLKEAFAVLSGKKKTEKQKQRPQFPTQTLENLGVYQFQDKELEDYINSKSIEFIFSEFNENRVNAGGADLSQHSRLDPSLSSLRKYFPKAKFTVYSDFDLKIEGVNLVKVENPVLQDKKHLPRHFYHLADYYKFKGMLDSNADIAVSIDSDMFVWSKEIYRLIYLTERFGFCVPNSSAKTMNFEINAQLDTIPITDNSNGYGTNCNITPMTLAKDSERGRIFYDSCCKMLINTPSRASIAMWNAAWDTSIYPYVLSKEFCIVKGDEGIGNEVLLHVGHPSVSEYYNIKI